MLIILVGSFGSLTSEYNPLRALIIGTSFDEVLILHIRWFIGPIVVLLEGLTSLIAETATKQWN